MTQRLRLLLCILVSLLALPFCAVEGLYRWSLADVGELPQREPETPLLRAHVAIWAAEEGGEQRVEPVWPWTVVRAVLDIGASHARPRFPPGSRLASGAGRSFLWELGEQGKRRHRAGAGLAGLTLQIWFTRNFSAEELLRWRASHAFFGRGARGLDAAALRCFGVEPAALTWAQAALLAGLLEGPSHYDPRKNPERAIARRSYVLRQLRAQGAISEAEQATAEAEPLPR